MTPSTPWPAPRRPLVAILRGVAPHEIEGIAEALVEAGFEALEVPLNSPDPFRSITLARKLAPAGCLVGAGTVLEPAEVDRLHGAGGNLVVSPNVEPAVIARATTLGMVTMPGVFTITEAFTALKAGASALKFFPASVLGPSGIRALRAVLPAGTVVGAVGGVSETDFAEYVAAGTGAFGLGSSLYKPGYTAAEVGARARAAVAAWDALSRG
ncbi:2-dehydro-3-deoxy-6-phosphogalactonate aldolase [Oceanicella sp. SM1341]|uniref:2-dehydro-3-deoxy-6-phosphogalactonate aldolase n=1 Tax=Oceanicella sp. SM1341 TaxID=1548889 RepID=UPI000E4D2B60|nr:2-dehydro-3-deoxy-6-phosphogalactonate aldolase [Oceanicella sp. SM1341]